MLELDLIFTSFKLEVLLKVEQELKLELKSSLLLVSKVEAAEVEVSRWQAAAPLASDSGAKKWAEEWSPRCPGWWGSEGSRGARRWKGRR